MKDFFNSVSFSYPDRGKGVRKTEKCRQESIEIQYFEKLIKLQVRRETKLAF